MSIRKGWLALTLGLGLLAGPAWGAEMGDLNPGWTDQVLPDFSNSPLGLPEVVWWVIACAVVCFVFWWLAKRSRWLHDRLYEPSTHAALAAFFGVGGAYLDSVYVDGAAAGQALMLVGVWFAFLGLITKEGRP